MVFLLCDSGELRVNLALFCLQGPALVHFQHIKRDFVDWIQKLEPTWYRVFFPFFFFVWMEQLFTLLATERSFYVDESEATLPVSFYLSAAASSFFLSKQNYSGFKTNIILHYISVAILIHTPSQKAVNHH